MIIPNYLKRGDRIGIASPAGKVNPLFVHKAKGELEKLGFQVIISKNALNSHYQYAASDQERLSDFQQLLDDEDVNAILCSRGGYGSIRIIERLDFSGFEKHPKWIIGFSDITIFHACLNNVLDIASIHGPMTKAFADNPDSQSVNYLIDILTGKEIAYQLPGHLLNRSGKCTGRLIGGNLAILTSLIGTNYDFNPEGKILFIEDIGEYLYRIDRMMWQLKQSNKLKSLSGLIVGQFSDMKDNDNPFGKNAYEIIAEHVSEYDFPVCFGFPAGHEDENISLRMGIEYRMKIDFSNFELRELDIYSLL